MSPIECSSDEFDFSMGVRLSGLVRYLLPAGALLAEGMDLDMDAALKLVR